MSMVMKAIPETSNQKKEMLEKSPIFETEIKMYEECLPKIQELWKSAGDDSILAPKYLTH
jgi:hypothetical protein